MNAHERVMCAFSHQEPDRVPIYTHVDNVAALELAAGRSLRTDPLEVTVQAIKHLGIDLCHCLLLPHWGVIDDGGFRRKWDGFLNWSVGTPFSSPDEAIELAKRRELPETKDALAKKADCMLEKVSTQQKLLGQATLVVQDVFGVPLQRMYDDYGFEALARMMYEEPDTLSRILETLTRNAVHGNEILADKYPGPIVFFPADIAAKETTLFSPRWLREEFFPRLKKTIRPLKEAGLKYLFHSCGNISNVIDDLIGAGVDAIQPLEVTAGMSLKELKSKYGGRLVLMGNADTNIIRFGSEEDIRQEVRRCIDEGSPGGGYFLEASGGYGQDTPAENILVFFEEGRSYGCCKHVRN